MNVLVTGGAGYIGTELIKELNEDESVDQVVVYDNLIRQNYNLFLGKSTPQRSKLRFVRGDILDSRRLKKEVDVADVVYHLAAKVTTPFADHNPHEFDQVNNWGTSELTYLIENSQVSRFIFASSVSVYGAPADTVDANTSPNPQTFYGISKMHGEEHVDRLRDSETEVFILRLGNVYGYSESMRFDSVINRFMFEANFTNHLRVFGDGVQKRSFIQINRLSRLLRTTGLSDQAPGTYNLVESTFTINEIVEELRSLYPSLDTIYVNQNMKLRSLSVEPDERLPELGQFDKSTLSADLKNFKTDFSF